MYLLVDDPREEHEKGITWIHAKMIRSLGSASKFLLPKTRINPPLVK